LVERGPSPRGWGKRGLIGPDDVLGRAIPTRVGKTSLDSLPARVGAGHPHAGGENNVGGGDSRILDGPSPRGWGKLQTFDQFVLYPRAIPTRVGKTASP